MADKSKREYAEDLEFTESGNWNSAQTFSDAMVARYYLEACEFERIATFGFNHPDERFLFPPHLIVERRLEALKWLIDSLRILIDNTYFALLSKDKPKATKYYNLLIETEDLLPYVQSTKTEFSRKVTIIQEDKFKLLIKDLRIIRRELHTYLNRADLIFRHKEEFDPVKWKQQAIDEMVNQG